MSQNKSETQFTVRCPVELKKQVEDSAERLGQSSAEWVRRAMEEKLEREANRAASASLNESMKAYIDAQIAEALGRAGVESREDIIVMPSASGGDPVVARKQKDGRLVILESRDGSE